MLPRGLVLLPVPRAQEKFYSCGNGGSHQSETKCTYHYHRDPIEYVHRHKNCVDQRVKADTESFPTALRYVLRQDPDVILVGEMRDLDTISAAISAAETIFWFFPLAYTGCGSNC